MAPDKPVKIVADENIAYASECFAALGELVLLAGRSISRADLVDADILLVRSVTQVNRELLAGTSVRFVGSCTIGTDHVIVRGWRKTASSLPMRRAVMRVPWLSMCCLPCWRCK